MCLKIATKDGI